MASFCWILWSRFQIPDPRLGHAIASDTGQDSFSLRRLWGFVRAGTAPRRLEAGGDVSDEFLLEGPR